MRPKREHLAKAYKKGVKSWRLYPHFRKVGFDDDEITRIMRLHGILEARTRKIPNGCLTDAWDRMPGSFKHEYRLEYEAIMHGKPIRRMSDILDDVHIARIRSLFRANHPVWYDASKKLESALSDIMTKLDSLDETLSKDDDKSTLVELNKMMERIATAMRTRKLILRRIGATNGINAAKAQQG